MEYAKESNSPEMMEYCRSLDNPGIPSEKRLEIEKKEFENLYLAAAKQGDITLCHTLEEKNITKKILPNLREIKNENSQTASNLYKSFLLGQQKYLNEQEKAFSNSCQSQREKAAKLLAVPDVLSIPEAQALVETADLLQKQAKHTMWNKVTSFFPFGIRTMKAWTDELVGLNQEVKNSLAYEASHAGDIGTLNAIEQILFPESIIQNDEVSLIELPS